MPINPINPYPIDLDAIKRKVGTTTFEQGMALAATLVEPAEFTKISFIVESQHKLVAAIEDGPFYVVKLSNLQGNIDGTCSCEKSENFDFCQHCVALSIYANQHHSKLKQMQQGSALERLEAYITGMPRSALESELLKLVAEDAERQQKYLALANIKHDQVDSAQLKKLIVKALPVKNIRQQANVKAYFEQAMVKITELMEIVSLLPSDTAFKMAEQMLWRYDTVMMKIEDANKYRLTCLTALKLNLIRCFKQLKWPVTKKAEYLYALHSSEYVHVDFEDIAAMFIGLEHGFEYENNLDLGRDFEHSLEHGLEHSNYQEHAQLSEEYHKLLIAHLQANGLQKNKATNALSPMQVRMVNSIANHFFATNNAEQAINFLILNSDSFASCISTIERCIEHALFDYIPPFFDKASRLAKQEKQFSQLHELQNKVERLSR